tara:strand:- start:61 stop:201 length:141 start_codon:yes stop_codon:yes gene_type:complete
MNSDNVKMMVTVASFLTREVAKENGVCIRLLLAAHGAKEATLLYIV